MSNIDKSITIEDLPDEILLRISRDFLELADNMNLSAVSRRFRGIANYCGGMKSAIGALIPQLSRPALLAMAKHNAINLTDLYIYAVEKDNFALFKIAMNYVSPKYRWTVLFRAMQKKSKFIGEIMKYFDKSENYSSIIFLACLADNAKIAERYCELARSHNIRLKTDNIEEDCIRDCVTSAMSDEIYAGLKPVFNNFAEFADFYTVMKLFTNSAWKDINRAEMIRILSPLFIGRIIYMFSFSDIFDTFIACLREILQIAKNPRKILFDIQCHIWNYSRMYNVQKKYDVLRALLSFERQYTGIYYYYVRTLSRDCVGDPQIFRKVYQRLPELCEERIGLYNIAEILPEIFTREYILGKLPDKLRAKNPDYLLYMAEKYPTDVLDSAGLIQEKYMSDWVCRAGKFDDFIAIDRLYPVKMRATNSEKVRFFLSAGMKSAYTSGRIDRARVQSDIRGMLRNMAKSAIIPPETINFADPYDISELLRLIDDYSLDRRDIYEMYCDEMPKSTTGIFTRKFARFSAAVGNDQ